MKTECDRILVYIIIKLEGQLFVFVPQLSTLSTGLSTAKTWKIPCKHWVYRGSEVFLMGFEQIVGKLFWFTEHCQKLGQNCT